MNARNGIITVLSTLALLATACGKDDEDTADINEQQVDVVARSAYTAIDGLSTGEGQAAASQLLAVGSSAFSLLQPTQSRSLGGGPDFGAELRAAMQADEGCSCTESSCTFTNCGSASGFVINGSLSWTADTMKCDYNVTANLQGLMYDYGIFCDVQYTPSSINGEISTDGSMTGNVQGQQQDVSWMSSLKFNNVTFSDAGQPTGGSISVSASVKANGESMKGSGTVEFP